VEATTSDSVTELARDLLAVTLCVFKASSQEYYELVAELDLSIAQIRMLHILDGHGGEVSVKELAEHARLSLPSTSRTVDALHQRGYIERREDEIDRRVKRVRLSEGGRELVTQLGAARLAGMEAFAATLTEAQRTRLRGALASVVSRDDICSLRPTTDS
jgi:DNA-binding MarR family transcriptional regulator